MKRTNYINDNDLVYNIIISKAKGKLTKGLEKQLILIVDNLIHKFSYNDIDDYNDCKQSAYLQLFQNWNKFDEIKYNKALPYYTELAKRAIANQYNILLGKNNQWSDIPINIRLTNLRQF